MPASAADQLRVGGLVPLTTVEWADKLTAVIFAQGCPWRCRFCHNTSLMPREGKLIPWTEIFRFLQERVGLLDGVVFSGGEPTAQAALPDAIRAVKDLGFPVALHTNGHNPQMLGELLQARLLDYVAMDVKGPFRRYHEITGIRGSGKKAQKSIGLILQSGVAYEFRTTYHSDLLSEEEVLAVAEDLAWRGAQSYFIQKFRPEGTGDMPLALLPSRELSPALLAKLQQMFPRFGIRS